MRIANPAGLPLEDGSLTMFVAGPLMLGTIQNAASKKYRGESNAETCKSIPPESKLTFLITRMPTTLLCNKVTSWQQAESPVHGLWDFAQIFVAKFTSMLQTEDFTCIAAS